MEKPNFFNKAKEGVKKVLKVGVVAGATLIPRESEAQIHKKLEPIVVSNPNDPRLKAYQDSSQLYTEAKENPYFNPEKNSEYKLDKFIPYDEAPELTPEQQVSKKRNGLYADRGMNAFNDKRKTAIFGKNPIKPIGFNRVTSSKKKDALEYEAVYEEPIQPVVYEKLGHKSTDTFHQGHHFMIETGLPNGWYSDEQIAEAKAKLQEKNKPN